MIRINLLPREDKGQRKATFSFHAADLIVPVAVLVAAGLVMAGTALSQRARGTVLYRRVL